MVEHEESYTLGELAKRTGQTTDVLRAYVLADKLEATKVTRGYRVAKSEADRFMKEINSGEVMQFEDVTIKKPIEYGFDGTVSTIFGISTGEIFQFMMKVLESIKDYNSGGSRDEQIKVTSEDVRLLHHLIKEGKIDVVPRENRVVVMDSDPTTAFLVKAMATGISCTFTELATQQNFSVESDKIKAASDYIVQMLE